MAVSYFTSESMGVTNPPVSLQIDFSEMVTISHIQIAGEFNDGEGTRFTKKFRIEYQRTEGGPWVKYTDENGDKVRVVLGLTNLVVLSPLVPAVKFGTVQP